MAQTKHKIPYYIKKAIIWHCRGYYEAYEWTLRNSEAKNGEFQYNFKLVNSVDKALESIGADLVSSEIRHNLREAIWESVLNGRECPYEIWDLPTIYRDDFYERKRKFIKEVAVNMGIIQQDD